MLDGFILMCQEISMQLLEFDGSDTDKLIKWDKAVEFDPKYPKY